MSGEIEARTFVDGAWYSATLQGSQVEIYRNTVWFGSGTWSPGGRLICSIALGEHILYALGEALEAETSGISDHSEGTFGPALIAELERVQLRVYSDAEKTQPTADSAVVEFLADGTCRIHDNQGTEWIGDPEGALAALGTVADYDWPAAWEALNTYA